MATYYIATTGNDTTGNGSSATPWLTISKAHTSASSGDTIICKDGTYTWASQTFTKALTIRAQNNGLVTLDGAGANLRWYFTANNVVISGITFEDAISTANANIAGIFEMDEAVTATNYTITFNNCTFQSTLSASTTALTRCIFGGGNSSKSGQDNFIFNSCLFNDLNVPASGNTGNAYFGSINSDIKWTFVNCVIYFNTTPCDYIFVSTYGAIIEVSIKNTIVFNATGATVNWWTSGIGGSNTPNAVSYSCLYSLTGAPSGSANITSNPLFVDAPSGNFALRPTSPCINTGTLV